MEAPAATPAPENSAANSASEADSVVDAAAAAHPHDFTVQKEVHRQIRNDPDYDDWEYGTEPLPQESWTTATAPTPDQA